MNENSEGPEEAKKTVFLSYRRDSSPLALHVFNDLRRHGFDSFIDEENIGSGDYENIIFHNIIKRVHFVVLLTPGALDRCDDPGDFFRREIETAIDAQRNIVLLLHPKFEIGSSEVRSRLVGKIALLLKYNALQLPNPLTSFYIESALKRLRENFLNRPLADVIHPSLPRREFIDVKLRDRVTTGVAIILMASSPLASALIEAVLPTFPESAGRFYAIDVSSEVPIDQIVLYAEYLICGLGSQDCIILTDVFGATPCNAAQRVARKFYPRVRVVAGVNVPMLWRVLNNAEKSVEYIYDMAIKSGVQGVLPAYIAKPSD